MELTVSQPYAGSRKPREAIRAARVWECARNELFWQIATLFVPKCNEKSLVTFTQVSSHQAHSHKKTISSGFFYEFHVIFHSMKTEMKAKMVGRRRKNRSAWVLERWVRAEAVWKICRRDIRTLHCSVVRLGSVVGKQARRKKNSEPLFPSSISLSRVCTTFSDGKRAHKAGEEGKNGRSRKVL